MILRLIKQLSTKWQAVNLQLACCSHKNIILNDKINIMSWHCCFKHTKTNILRFFYINLFYGDVMFVLSEMYLSVPKMCCYVSDS